MRYILALILVLNTLPVFAEKTLEERILKLEEKIHKTKNDKKATNLYQQLSSLRHQKDVETLLMQSDLTQPECLQLAELGIQEKNYFRQNDIIIKMVQQCHVSESTLSFLQQTNLQSQLNNIQNQQNYTNWLLLQHNLNHR